MQHWQRLLQDAGELLDRYLDGMSSEEVLQAGIDAIGNALEQDAPFEIRRMFKDFPERMEEILCMELPARRRERVGREAGRLKAFVDSYLR